LVAAALSSIDDEVRLPDSGNTREDFIALVRDFARVSMSTVLGPMISRVAGVAIGNPELMEIVWNNLIAKRQAIGKELLRRGIARGDVRPDVNVDLVMDMVAGTVIFNVLFHRVDPSEMQSKLERLVETIWTGIRDELP